MGLEYWFVFGGTHHCVEEVMVVVVPACLLGTYSRYLLPPALYSSNCMSQPCHRQHCKTMSALTSQKHTQLICFSIPNFMNWREEGGGPEG
jgi:hypothetical protein